MYSIEFICIFRPFYFVISVIERSGGDEGHQIETSPRVQFAVRMPLHSTYYKKLTNGNLATIAFQF